MKTFRYCQLPLSLKRVRDIKLRNPLITVPKAPNFIMSKFVMLCVDFKQIFTSYVCVSWRETVRVRFLNGFGIELSRLHTCLVWATCTYVSCSPGGSKHTPQPVLNKPFGAYLSTNVCVLVCQLTFKYTRKSMFRISVYVWCLSLILGKRKKLHS